MSGLFLKVLNLSASASWMILAVLIFRTLLKKAPKWVSVLLWGMVAVRLICPFSIESAVSLIPSAQVISPAVLLETPQIQTGIPAVDAAIGPWVQGAAVTVAPEKSVSAVKLLIRILSGVWAAGAVLLLVYTGISYWRLRRGVDTAVLWKDGAYQSENVDAPFVLGVFRPRIYLPFGMEEQKLCHVVAHERAHIQRKDHWWKPLGFLLLTVHWMNPLMWVAYVLLCRDIELACDEKVIKKLGSQQRADYTQALVACSIRRRRIAACPLAFGEVGVKERVRSVMNYKKPAFRIILLAVICCAVTAVCFLTNPETGVRNPWVREYVPGTEGIRGNVDPEKYENISGDFAIGADQYGRAVFKDPHKALRTLGQLYSEEIKAIRKEFGLLPLSRATAGLYKTYGWQMTGDSRDTAFVSGFLDIYENSFTKEVPPEETAPPTESGPLAPGEDGIQMGDLSSVTGDPQSAIARAILDRCRADAAGIEAELDRLEAEADCALGRDGLLYVESHVILATESSGRVYQTDGEARMGMTAEGRYAMERAVFYLLVHHAKYSTCGETPEARGGSLAPAVLTFRISESGEYILEEYWEPREGSFYARDIRDRFPEGAAEAVLENEAYVEELKDRTYRKALEYLLEN